ncbi:hypothetical protein BaRGS_00026916 [Batillaria attramentaria]|uniref:Uncharacterized protein n=1 Tax=Batillaria attramentaria TaxID=370345 RepID=A0ABD0K4P1_9CAEN
MLGGSLVQIKCMGRPGSLSKHFRHHVQPAPATHKSGDSVHGSTYRLGNDVHELKLTFVGQNVRDLSPRESSVGFLNRPVS